jgi:hypothetical protein
MGTADGAAPDGSDESSPELHAASAVNPTSVTAAASPNLSMGRSCGLDLSAR